MTIATLLAQVQSDVTALQAIPLKRSSDTTVTAAIAQLAIDVTALAAAINGEAQQTPGATGEEVLDL